METKPVESTNRRDAKPETSAPSDGGSSSRLEKDVDAALYVMSVAAELAGLHPQTLRLYERKGLIGPARSDGGNRRYGDADLARMRRIGELTGIGINLEGVRRILELQDENEALRAQLDAARAEVSDAVARTHRQYRRDLQPYWSGAPWRQAGEATTDGRLPVDGDGTTPPPDVRR